MLRECHPGLGALSCDIPYVFGRTLCWSARRVISLFCKQTTRYGTDVVEHVARDPARMNECENADPRLGSRVAPAGAESAAGFILRADSDAALSCSAPAPRDAAAFCFRPRATGHGSESECERAFANTLAQTLENFSSDVGSRDSFAAQFRSHPFTRRKFSVVSTGLPRRG